MEQLLTVKQAAEILGVSADVMREMIWSNQIGYIDLNNGGRYIKARFTKKHIDDFIKRNEVKAG